MSLRPLSGSSQIAFVVDDEIQVRTFVSGALRAFGYVVHQFRAAVDVEAALAGLVPDTIILDLALGGSDAIEVIRVLAGVRYRGQVLLISGRDAETVAEVQRVGEARALNMLPALCKPFRIQALRSALESGPNPNEALSEEPTLSAGLRNDWLELWYQPKIDLKSRLVCGAKH